MYIGPEHLLAVVNWEIRQPKILGNSKFLKKNILSKIQNFSLLDPTSAYASYKQNICSREKHVFCEDASSGVPPWNAFMTRADGAVVQS